MAKATGRKIKNWYRLLETQEYLQVLAKRCNLRITNDDKLAQILPNLTQKEFVSYNDPVLIEVQRGRTGGTYFYPKLALRFAQWCSAEFAKDFLDDKPNSSLVQVKFRNILQKIESQEKGYTNNNADKLINDLTELLITFTCVN